MIHANDHRFKSTQKRQEKREEETETTGNDGVTKKIFRVKSPKERTY